MLKNSIEPTDGVLRTPSVGCFRFPMWTRTIAAQLLRSLALERRRVVSDWRILVLCRRIATESRSPLPDEAKARSVVRHLIAAGDLAGVDGARGVYLVETPFATVLPVAPEEIVQEADPWAALSHLTALSRLGLTDEIPTRIFATHFNESVARTPLGTRAEEWAGLQFPNPRFPHQIGGTPVQWTRTAAEFEFGITIEFSHGLPIYVTDQERTLLDAIREPGKSGGIETVLRAWKEASPRFDLGLLLDYTERFRSPLMRQRVGFVLSRLGQSHQRLEDWKQSLRRGGSMVLVAGAPFSPEFDAEWNLSLNVPEGVLTALDGDA